MSVIRHPAFLTGPRLCLGTVHAIRLRISSSYFSFNFNSIQPILTLLPVCSRGQLPLHCSIADSNRAPISLSPPGEREARAQRYLIFSADDETAKAVMNPKPPTQTPRRLSDLRATARSEVAEDLRQWHRQREQDWIDSVAVAPGFDPHQKKKKQTYASSPYGRESDMTFERFQLEPLAGGLRKNLENATRLYNVAASAVSARESRIAAILDDDSFHHVAIRELRERTLAAAEAILDWRRGAVECHSSEMQELPVFLWEGQNYLLCLAGGDDVEQLFEAFPNFKTAVQQEQHSDVPSKRNALLTSCDVDALAADQSSASGVDGTQENLLKARLRRVARALMAEERAAQAVRLRETTSKTNRLVVTESEATRLVPPVLDTEDLEAVAREPNPPLAVVATLACLHVVLYPDLIRPQSRGLPSVETLQARPLRHTLLKAPRRLAAKLASFDVTDQLPMDLLRLLWPVLTSNKFTADEVNAHSALVGTVFHWLQGLVVLHSCRRNRHHPETTTTKTDDDDPKVTSMMEDLLRTAEKKEDDEPDQSKLLNGLCDDLATLKAEMLAMQKTPSKCSTPKSTLTSAALDDISDDRRTSLLQRSENLAIYAVGPPVSEGLQLPPSTLSEFLLLTEEKDLFLHSFDQDQEDEEDTRSRAVAAYDVDRMTGYVPSELASLPSAEKTTALEPLVRHVGNLSDAERTLHVSQRVVNGVNLGIRVELLSTAEMDVGAAQRDDGGLRLRIVVAPSRMNSDETPLTLELDDDTLALLLLHQSGLFERAHQRWKSLRALGDWVATRISFERKRQNTTTPDVSLHDRLDMDRHVPLPPEAATLDRAMIQVEQRDRSLQIRIVGDGATLAKTDLDVVEIRAFTGIHKQQRRDGLQTTSSSLAALRQRLTVESIGDQLLLHVDKVVYQEVRRVSGKSLALRALVHGKDLLFEAVLVDEATTPVDDVPKPRRRSSFFRRRSSSTKSPPTEEKKSLFDLTKVVTEAEARELMSETARKELVLAGENRGTLAKIVAAKLKLIETSSGRFELETTLTRETCELAVGVDGTGKQHLIGSITVDDAMTLDDVRRKIVLELDDVPETFRFQYGRAPCGRRQEPYRHAVNCKPTLVLLTTKDPVAIASAPVVAVVVEEKEDTSSTKKKIITKKKDPVEETTAEKKPRSKIFSKVAEAFGGRKHQPRKTRHKTETDGPVGPPSLPGLVDPLEPVVLATVAVPLGTLATVFQGRVRLELADALDDLKAQDIVRLGSRHGADWTVTVTTEGRFELASPYDHHLASRPDPAKLPRTAGSRVHAAAAASATEDDKTEHVMMTEEDLDFDPETLLLLTEAQKNKHHVDIEEGTEFTKVIIYKVVPKAVDMRPRWRVAFDSGFAPFGDDFRDSKRKVVHFRIPLKFSQLETLIRDATTRDQRHIHAQRCDFFHKVAIDALCEAIFQYLCSWYPQSTEGVDGAKWAKFARDNDLIPDVRNPVRAAQVDIAFKRQFAEPSKNHKHEAMKRGGRLTRPMLREALTELALIKYPPKPPSKVDSDNDHEEPVVADEVVRRTTLKRLIREKILMIPAINRRVWREAKVLAMLSEAKRQAAAMRIQTCRRCRYQRNVYRRILRAVITGQAAQRRFLFRKYYRLQWALCDVAYAYRRRFGAAFRLQIFWRRFTVRRAYKERKRRAKEEYLKHLELRRGEQCQRTDLIRDSTVFRRVKFVTGWLVKTRIRRTQTSRALATADFGLLIEVYVPKTQEMFRFKMTDNEVRMSLELVLGVDGLSGDEILDPHALAHIADRLLVRVVNKRPIVIFTRRGHSERGLQVLRRGLLISGEAFVVTAFHSEDEVVFHAYSGKTSETLRTSVLTKFFSPQIF